MAVMAVSMTGCGKNSSVSENTSTSNDTISIYDGIFNVTTNKDGFHCENDEAEGTITISGGTFTINGTSDGIQACAVLQIDGGDFDITAAEGLEATYIVINDGNITIDASDDGINAVTNTNAYETAIIFNGGTIIVNGQEVSEIPQSMMGGGMRGGMNSGFGGGRGGRF